jgi:D-alanyl-lipoteichoic acid acyltransferase DltB (MBOAT superfamily)
MLTMIIGGLWHGAAWTFVLWGFYQGLVLVVGRWVAGLGITLGHTWQRVLLGIGVFHVTCFGWLIFRAQSLEQVGTFSRALVADFRWSGSAAGASLVSLLAIIAPLLVVHVWQARHDDELAVFKWPRLVRYAVFCGVAYLSLLFGDFEGAEFIYFQF